MNGPPPGPTSRPPPRTDRKAGQAGLIVSRELGRTAKRWQRILLRSGSVGLIVLVFLAVLAFAGRIEDSGELADLGKMLFGWSFGLLFFAAVLIPALQVIQAVQAERDNKTLGLLALTGLTPTQVLFGLLGARGYRGFLIIAATAPLLALIPTLGGVSLTTAIGSLAVLLMAFLTTLGVAAVVGIGGRSVAVSVLALVGFWALIALLAPVRLSVLLSEMAGGEQLAAMAWLFPFDDRSYDPALAVLGLFPWMGAALAGAYAAAWRFRAGVANGWASRGKSWPGVWWGWVIHVPIQAGGWIWLETSHNTALSHPTPYWSGPWPLVGQVVTAALLLSGALLYLRAMSWLLPRLDLGRERLRIPVIGDPILWRELLTNAQGGLSRGVAIVTFAWVLVAGILVWNDGDDFLLVWSMMAGLGTVLMSVLLVSSSVLEERRRGTLPLLGGSTLPSWNLVRGKLVAAVLRLLPLVVLGVSLALYERFELLGGGSATLSPIGYELSGEMPWILTTVPAVRLPITLAWCFSVWLVLLCLSLILSLVIRNRALATTAPPLLTVGLLLLVCGAAAVGLGVNGSMPLADLLKLASQLLFPLLSMLDSGVSLAGVPPYALISVGLWGTLALAMLRVTVLAMRHHATRRD